MQTEKILVTGGAGFIGTNLVTDSPSGFRCITRKAALALYFNEQNRGISSEMIFNASNMGLRIAEVPHFI